MPQISLQEILLKQIVIVREIGLLVHRTVTTDYITLTDRKSNEKLREYLEEQINENLIQAVLSAGRNKRMAYQK